MGESLDNSLKLRVYNPTQIDLVEMQIASFIKVREIEATDLYAAIDISILKESLDYSVRDKANPD